MDSFYGPYDVKLEKIYLSTLSICIMCSKLLWIWQRQGMPKFIIIIIISALKKFYAWAFRPTGKKHVDMNTIYISGKINYSNPLLLSSVICIENISSFLRDAPNDAAKRICVGKLWLCWRRLRIVSNDFNIYTSFQAYGTLWGNENAFVLLRMTDMIKR